MPMQTILSPGKRSKLGYQRNNGRWEARYRPQTRVPLIEDSVVGPAYKGCFGGIHKYEFLEYFDSLEEKDEWVQRKKEDFLRRKHEAHSQNFNKKRQQDRHHQRHNKTTQVAALDKDDGDMKTKSYVVISGRRLSSPTTASPTNPLPKRRKCLNRSKKQAKIPSSKHHRQYSHLCEQNSNALEPTVSVCDSEGLSGRQFTDHVPKTPRKTTPIRLSLCKFSGENAVTGSFCIFCGPHAKVPCASCLKLSTIQTDVPKTEIEFDDEIGNALLDGLIDKLSTSINNDETENVRDKTLNKENIEHQNQNHPPPPRTDSNRGYYFLDEAETDELFSTILNHPIELI